MNKLATEYLNSLSHLHFGSEPQANQRVHQQMMSHHDKQHIEQIENMFKAKEGFEKGNMFKNLYESYKHHQPPVLRPRNEREQMLLKIDELAFCMHEINLYLNVHPENMRMIEHYNKYQKEYNRLLREFEAKVGPIQVNNDHMTTSPFTWTEGNWPWEVSTNV